MKRALTRMMTKGEVVSTNELSQIARTQYDIEISPSTARTMLREQGVKVRHTIRKPELTAEHKRKRFEFAQEHADWSVDDWKRVIFSDETIITTYPVNAKHLVWTKSTNPLDHQLIIPAVQGGGSKIMLWGCISKYGFHDMVQLEDRVDATQYIEVLKEYLIPVIHQYFNGQPCIFQQDGASIHTAHAVTDFFKDHNIQVLEWPPHSPDLNIIEHVWHYLKLELHKLPAAHNRERLWNHVHQTMQKMWSEEMTEKINDLYESMPRRLVAIIRAHGGNTKY
jgi:transposase